MTTIIAIISAIVAVFLAIDKFLNQRKAFFVNTVTSERMKWIGTLRENISDFAGLAHVIANMIPSDPSEYGKLIEDLERKRVRILLSLNPYEKEHPFDEQITHGVYEVILHALERNRDELKTAIEDLITPTQDYLKREWDRVKREAVRGRFSDKTNDEIILINLVSFCRGTKKLFINIKNKKWD